MKLKSESPCAEGRGVLSALVSCKARHNTDVVVNNAELSEERADVLNETKVARSDKKLGERLRESLDCAEGRT